MSDARARSDVPFGRGSSGEPFVTLGERVLLWQGDLSRHEQTNVGIVRDENAVIVIDANFESAASRIHRSIRERDGLEVSHVVNTHYHVDHSLGNSVYADAGATIVGAHGQRRELLEKGPADAVVQIGSIPDRWTPTSVEFTDSLFFCDARLQLMVVGPAHTAADVIAWIPEDGVLFVGDLAVAWAHGNNFSDVDADIEGWIAALTRCIALRPRTVVPAHGRTSGLDILTGQRNFIEDLWGWALGAADSGADRMSDDIAADLMERHRPFAVSPEKLEEMADSMVAAAQRGISTA